MCPERPERGDALAAMQGGRGILAPEVGEGIDCEVRRGEIGCE